MNKHDIELLEAAAKAAGATDTHQWSNKFAASFKGRLGLQKWNPLDDDGDAFRLAVKLEIAFGPVYGVAEVGTTYMAGPFRRHITEEFTRDPLKATRRAIVRAAAHIGGHR